MSRLSKPIPNYQEFIPPRGFTLAWDGQPNVVDNFSKKIKAETIKFIVNFWCCLFEHLTLTIWNDKKSLL